MLFLSYGSSTVLRAMSQHQLQRDTAKISPKDIPAHLFASKHPLPYKEGRSLLPKTRSYFLRPMNIFYANHYYYFSRC